MADLGSQRQVLNRTALPRRIANRRPAAQVSGARAQNWCQNHGKGMVRQRNVIRRQSPLTVRRADVF